MLKIFSNKKTGIFLISFLVFSGLFLRAQPAHAIFGVGDIGILDLGTMQLDALDFVDNVVLRSVVFIVVLGIESQAFLSVAAHLLQWAVSQPVHLSNALVASGFNFVSGLTNLFFILIFVGIALAFILKTETFGMKKALPNLIIIALLINFSLVFVGMITDIGDIFRNALLSSFGNNFVSLATEPLNQSAWSVFGWFMAIPVGYLITALIPYANVAGLAIIAVLFLTDISTGGMLLKGLFLIVLNFVTGGIFFLYFGLFLVRIVIIWILAISAPLALFAYILPATKKYFSQWLHYLISWTFMGIAAIFLIGLGLTLFSRLGGDSLLSWGTDINTGRGVLPSMIYNYLFLIIYLGITFFICKKFVPMGADMIMKQGEALIGKTWGSLKGTRTMGQVAENTVRGLDTAAKWGDRLQTQGKGLAKPLGWLTKRAAGAPIPALTEYGARMRRISAPAGWKQMSIPEKVRYIESQRREMDKLVLASEMKGEGTFQKTDNKFKNKIADLATKFGADERLKNIYRKEIGDIFDAFPDKLTVGIALDLAFDRVGMGEKIQKETDNIEAKIKLAPELNNTILNETAAQKFDKDVSLVTAAEKASVTTPEREAFIKNRAAGIVAFKEMKTADYGEVSKGSITSLTGKLAFDGMTDRQLQKIYDTFGRDVMDTLVNTEGGVNKIFDGKSKGDAEKLVKQLYKGNPRLFRFATQTPAGRAMNFEFTKYMLDPDDQPTANPDDFERSVALEEKLTNLSEYGGAYVSIRDALEYEKKQLSELKTKYEEAKVDAEEELPCKFIVNSAYKAEKKSYPVRWLIVVVSTLSAFLLAVLVLIVLDNLKRRKVTFT